PVGGEQLPPAPSPVRVDLDDVERFPLEGTDVEGPTGEPARRRRVSEEGERRAEGGERLLAERRVSSLQEGPPREEHSFTVPGGAGRVVHDLDVIGDQAGERVRVAGRHRRIDKGRVRSRGV